MAADGHHPGQHTAAHAEIHRDPVAEDVLGAAKNGSAKVPIVKVFIFSTVKERAGHVVSFPR